MNFQYFFFDTYIGYFLQALPFALIAGAIYGIIRFRKDTKTPMFRKVFSCAFVCYLMGLVCLVIGLDLMGIFYYKLFYRMDPGRDVRWFGGAIDLVPDFYNNINGEVIGNLLMFLPFGVLYPLSQKEPTWKRSVLAGLLTVACIEVIQPIFGRSFDTMNRSRGKKSLQNGKLRGKPRKRKRAKSQDLAPKQCQFDS